MMRVPGLTRWAWLLSLPVLALVTACSEPPPPPTEAIRSIRTITVTEPATGKMRRFSGVVEAADTSSISFEVPGNVQEVNVEVGERVTRGQVLAVLDDRTFKLNVEAAQAAVGGAEVELADARSELERFRRIAAQDAGAISTRSLDQAEAAYNGTRQNLSYSNSRLNLAKRDLERTSLLAPFDGVIATRNVDPFQEVNRGEPMFDLFIEGAMQAAISIPESEIDRVYLGLPAKIRFPAIAGQYFKGIVTEISKVAGAANAFPVKVTIDDESANTRIRPGITAEVNLQFAGEEDGLAYLVPIGALSPGGESGNYVYVYDPETSTVQRTAIVDDGIRDSDIVVTSGVNAGDIVAVAGVSFLRDGQKVRLMEQ
jgi:multidrug efflux system membrane fusion protein